MPYRVPWNPASSPCRCAHAVERVCPRFGPIYTWHCCRCRHENHAEPQFCRACGHARNLRPGEVDVLLVDLGLAEFPTHSRGPG